MRRYKLDISDREFVVDVQEIAADRFAVVVGDESYEVTLSSDENLGEATITPGFQAGAGVAPRVIAVNTAARVTQVPAPAADSAAAAPAPRKPAGGGGKGTLTAPMPGVILEVNVKAGDKIERAQQVAVLDAMKMHNVIGAPRAGTVAEVFVTAGESVDHGDAIFKYQED